MFLVTVTVAFERSVGSAADELARALADGLMGDGAVVTVRIGGQGETSVFRVDVLAPSRNVAVAAAQAIPAGVAERLELGYEIVSIDAVLETERPPSPS